MRIKATIDNHVHKPVSRYSNDSISVLLSLEIGNGGYIEKEISIHQDRHNFEYYLTIHGENIRQIVLR